MMAAESSILDDAEDIGALVNNHRLVEALREAFLSGEHAYASVPSLMDEVIDEDAWRRRLDPNGKPFRPADFIKFIEGPEPEGLGKPLDEARRYLGGSDNPLRVKFENLITNPPGGPNNPLGLGGWSHKSLVNPNAMRVDESMDEPRTIPIPGRVRDRSREPQAGTSIGYGVRRLGRERPDLLERVKAGELTVHGGMVIAGFIPKAITIPAEPVSAARRLVRHFTPDQFNVLVATALDLYLVRGGEEK